MPAPCPLCGLPMHPPQSIDVCGRCGHSLDATDQPSVRVTGEFSVAAQVAVAAVRRSAAQPSEVAVSCTWCGKGAAAVKKLLSQGSAHICNECIALCTDVLEAELGESWRH